MILFVLSSILSVVFIFPFASYPLPTYQFSKTEIDSNLFLCATVLTAKLYLCLGCAAHYHGCLNKTKICGRTFRDVYA
jgi:hypothetical protein